MAKIWTRKSIAALEAEAAEPEVQALTTHDGVPLKRSLAAINLVALGIGAIIGAGLFVRTGPPPPSTPARRSRSAFVLAGLGCAFAGLCYAEFASMIPIAGSAYTYAYATMGELVAWIIGWDLILEYAVGAATVAIAWSEYFNKLPAESSASRMPYGARHSPPFAYRCQRPRLARDRRIINLPAMVIIVCHAPRCSSAASRSRRRSTASSS